MSLIPDERLVMITSLVQSVSISSMELVHLAALADIGRVTMSVGFRNAFEGTFEAFGKGRKDFKLGAEEVILAGEASEVALHGRWDAVFDLDNFYTAVTPFEKFAEGAVNKMFIMNMLAPYTDLMKRFSGSIIQSEMIRLSLKWANDIEYTSAGKGVANRSLRDDATFTGTAGKLKRDELMMLTKVGIDLDDAVLIAEQFKTHGKKGDKLHLANTQAWTDPIITKKFRTALVMEINNAVVTPGPAEKLNFMGSQLGSLMTQFKSFGLSATHRTTLAGLQQKDAKALHGLLSMFAMGYMVDMLKSPSYDSRDMLSTDRFVQAAEYSGVTGILFDINNMAEVISGNEFGIRPMLGVKSFFQDPNYAQKSGQIGGPAASLGFDLVNSMINPDADGSDMARSVRRLLPFNNLFWFSGLVDRLQRSVGKELDEEEIE